MRRKGELRFGNACSPTVPRAIEQTILMSDHWFQARLTRMSTTYPLVGQTAKTGILATQPSVILTLPDER